MNLSHDRNQRTIQLRSRQLRKNYYNKKLVKYNVDQLYMIYIRKVVNQFPQSKIKNITNKKFTTLLTNIIVISKFTPTNKICKRDSREDFTINNLNNRI